MLSILQSLWKLIEKADTQTTAVLSSMCFWKVRNDQTQVLPTSEYPNALFYKCFSGLTAVMYRLLQTWTFVLGFH